ncbi:MAG: type II toxin-antitoxin system HicB family antitoxin [Chloroflexota bacterium]|nr:type II toxin-antitoxin system HicB family antitoxin [Chloroflexota bacterium]
MNLTYAIVVEQTPNNYAAYAPDVPGCVTTADSLDAIESMMCEALGLHIESMLKDGDPLPEPKLSIEEAIAFHSNALAEYGDPVPTISTTFRLLDVDIAVRQTARAS